MRSGALSTLRQINLRTGPAAARPRADFAAPTTINAATSTTGWTANSGAAIATEAAPAYHPNGTNTFLSITCPTADTFVSGRSTSVPGGFKLSNYEIVGVWIYWSASQGSVALRFTSDNFASKNKTFSWAWSGQLHLGWNLLTIRPDDDGTTAPGGLTWTVAGGFLDTDTVNGVEVQVNTNGGAQTKIFVGGVIAYATVPTKGVVMFGFDAFGEATIPGTALPILDAAGIKGYWAGDANLVDGNTNAKRLAQIVYDAGWDLITQGKNHVDYTANSTLLQADIDYAKGVWRANGWTRGYDQWAYPLSANDVTTDDIVSRNGYVMGRSGWTWAVHPNEFNAGPKLIGFGATNLGGKLRAAGNAIIDRAAKYGTAEAIFSHAIAPGGDGTSFPANALQIFENDTRAWRDRIVQWRTLGRLEALTPSAYYRTRA